MHRPPSAHPLTLAPTPHFLPTRSIPTEAEGLTWFNTLINWARRDDDNQPGALIHTEGDALLVHPGRYRRRQEIDPPPASTPKRGIAIAIAAGDVPWVAPRRLPLHRPAHPQGRRRRYGPVAH